MNIVKASKKDKQKALKIASSLKDWFTTDALKNMSLDFEMNNLVVAKEQNKVVGFLCYSSFSGKMLLMWLGVDPSWHGKGVGTNLLSWLEDEARRLGLYSIEVETLPDEIEYEPYEKTRNFYYKNGFKRVLYKKASIEGWDDQIILEKLISF